MSKMQRAIKGVVVLGGVWIAGHWFASNWSGTRLAERGELACVAIVGLAATTAQQESLPDRKRIIEKYTALWRAFVQDLGVKIEGELVDGLPTPRGVQGLPAHQHHRLLAMMVDRNAELRVVEGAHDPNVKHATPAAFCACRRNEAVADRSTAMIYTATIGMMKREAFAGFEQASATCGTPPRRLKG